jgi:hypothetical protein
MGTSFAVNNFGDTRSGGLAGPMGLFVIVLLCIATVLLIRNMNKRLRRLPDSFSTPQQTQREAEIARLNADLDAPAVGEEGPNVEQSRSVTPADGTEDEVKAVNTERDGSSTDGDHGRL